MSNTCNDIFARGDLYPVPRRVLGLWMICSRCYSGPGSSLACAILSSVVGRLYASKLLWLTELLCFDPLPVVSGQLGRSIKNVAIGDTLSVHLLSRQVSEPQLVDLIPGADNTDRSADLVWPFWTTLWMTAVGALQAEGTQVCKGGLAAVEAAKRASF